MIGLPRGIIGVGRPIFSNYSIGFENVNTFNKGEKLAKSNVHSSVEKCEQVRHKKVQTKKKPANKLE